MFTHYERRQPREIKVGDYMAFAEKQSVSKRMSKVIKIEIVPSPRGEDKYDYIFTGNYKEDGDGKIQNWYPMEDIDIPRFMPQIIIVSNVK